MRKLAAAILCMALCACPSDLASALRSYGYAPVRPASTLWQPGAMIFVRSRDPLEIGFICTAAQIMGPNFKPMESLTTNADLARASKKGLSMAAHVQDIVTADADLQDIKSVKLNLKNVKIFEISDWDVEEASRHADKRCLRAIARRRAQGFEVTMIEAAIQADVSYSVNFQNSSKLTVDAKVAAVQNLSAKLGVDASRTNDKVIEGQGLVYGIRDSSYAAWFFDPQHLPEVDRGSSIISADMSEQLQVMLTPPTPVAADTNSTALPEVPTPTLAMPHPDVEETPEQQYVPPKYDPQPAHDLPEQDDEPVEAPPPPSRPPLRRTPNSKRHSMTF